MLDQPTNPLDIARTVLRPETLREVRMALLEADVALPVTRDFVKRVKEQALGAGVKAAASFSSAETGI